jgi:hypothetical protein
MITSAKAMRASSRIVAAALGPALFALAGLAFFLPGATFSDCSREGITVTGWQIVTHTQPGGSEAHGLCLNNTVDWLNGTYAVLATVTFVAATAGFVLAVARARRGPGFCAGAGLVAMLIGGMPSGLSNSPNYSPHSGALLALSAFATNAIWYGWKAVRRWDPRPFPPPEGRI